MIGQFQPVALRLDVKNIKQRSSSQILVRRLKSISILKMVLNEDWIKWVTKLEAVTVPIRL